ncbi:MAG TPA: ATP-binding protein [Candidatus Limnocylindrales bacterium]
MAEHALAVIIDLTAVTVVDEIPLLVLPTLARNHDVTPIVVFARPGGLDTALIRSRLSRHISVFTEEAAAIAAAKARNSSRRLHVHLEAESAAPATARALVRRGCTRWGLSELCPNAELIISELVTNSVRHARSDVEVTLAVGEYYMHIHVRDRDHRIPRIYSRNSTSPEHSRGMRLVDGFASGWGTTTGPFGKSVWATLRIKRRELRRV